MLRSSDANVFTQISPLGSERTFSSTSSNVGATPAVLVDQFAGKYLAGPPGGACRAGVLQAVGAFLPRLIIRRCLCVDLRGVFRVAEGRSYRVIRGYVWCAVSRHRARRHGRSSPPAASNSIST